MCFDFFEFTMDCQVRSMADNNPVAEGSVPSGKVESVCREWLVREDGVLAYKLQTEEIEHHYGHNKERNQIVRSDIQEAKTIQRTEEEEALMMQNAYEQMLQEQENADALIAKQIQEKFLQEEQEKLKRIEEEDKRIALELQKKEKLRLQKKREERELRQVEKARAAAAQSALNTTDSLPLQASPINMTKEASTSPLEEDFTDLCLAPPRDLSEEEMRKFREEQDAELARFLQEQEMKRRGQSFQDQKIAIEAQDRELAKMLQEQERARAIRAKERAKQKALLQQQNNSQHKMEEAQLHSSYDPEKPDDQTSQTGSISKNHGWYSVKHDVSGYSASSINNVAMAIDPTYNPKAPLVSPILSDNSICSTPLSSPEHLSADPGLNMNDKFNMPNEEEECAPPYMPIQGQRRLSSLEKEKKSKKSKDGCKTQ